MAAEPARELDVVVPELDWVAAVDPPDEPALDVEEDDVEPDELVLGVVWGGGVGVGAVVTVGVGSGLTGAGSGFGPEAAKLADAATIATTTIASMLSAARDT